MNKVKKQKKIGREKMLRIALLAGILLWVKPKKTIAYHSKKSRIPVKMMNNINLVFKSAH